MLFKDSTPDRRAFGDTATTRGLIFDNVLAAAQGIKPVSNTRHTLELADVHYDGPDQVSIADQKKAILTGQTLGRRLRGTWRLKDSVSGKVLDERVHTLAQVPHMTNRGTFILGGSEYTLAHQLRLKAGIYARLKESGEPESHVNVLPGQGLSHRYQLDPASGRFYINVAQSRMPLMPLLRAMGVGESHLRQAWGNDLMAANMLKDDPSVIDKLHARLVRSKPGETHTHESRAQAVSEAFSRMALDPEVSKRTLGKPYENLSPDAILDATTKLLKLNRGEAEPDDRDHLAYQTVLGPEDLLAERLRRDKGLLRQLLWKASFKGTLDPVHPNALTRHVHSAILGSGLGLPLEEINTSDVFDQQAKVTRMGEGGISSMDSVPDESRSVQPSHLGYVDIVRTPESGRVGVDSRFTYTARKGRDGKVYSPFRDVRTGQTVLQSPQDISDAVIAFPNELRKGRPMVAALVGGKTRYVPRSNVQFEMPAFEGAFSPLGNMVPAKSASKAQRMAMGSRMYTQALALQGAEAPLVQSGVPGMPDTSFEDAYGEHMGAVRARADGRVVSVGPGGVKVRYADGKTEEHELYSNFPFNRKSFLHNEPLVQPGDPVRAGQVLAKSNYTDHNGTVAMGLNPRTAFMAFKGKNFEDATVVSESMSKRLMSEHMYQSDHEWEDKHKVGKRAYTSIFPATYDKKVLSKLDDEGVILPGQVVHHGDPMVLVAEQKDPSHNAILKSRSSSFADKSVTWDHHFDGVVTDVARTKKGVTVAVKAYVPAQVGDKISGRYGNKGVIADVVPDDEMPVGEDGQPFELLLNPLGVISRGNPAQVIEMALAKVAAKTGKPYKIPDFQDIDDLNEYAIKELEKNGLSDTETVTDPSTGRKIPGVLAGRQFIMKLHHTSESKSQGRGLGSYTSEGIPAKGSDESSKKLALMNSYALLSHGGIDILRDAGLVRGQRNDEYWQTFMTGHRPPPPKVPFVYEKFVNMLKASGINVVRSGNQTKVMALTDKDIDEQAGDRALQNAETVSWKEGLKPIKGGLFDPALTGGHNGNRWSRINLHERMPNPVFEEPIRRLLGLTQKKFEDVLAGKEVLNDHRGPEAISNALGRINVPRAIEQARAEIHGGRKGARDDAIRKLGYLKAAERLGIHPKDWVVSSVPVLPPAFRPVSTMLGGKSQLISDPNYLYKEVMDANGALKELSGQVDDVSQERLNLYNAFKGVVGLGDPLQPKNQERQVRGLLRHVFGDSPKFGWVQQKLLGSSVNMVGRAVITPNPDLDMDEVGLPETRAWAVYKPFVIRRLVRNGMPGMEAARAVEDRQPRARSALLQEMEARPVIVDRAPVLHRYGVMAFRPKLVQGHTLHVSPFVVKGFGADFDGDQMNYHVPVTDESVDEALHKMLPSRNLFSAATFKATTYLPGQEYAGGLWAASTARDRDKRPRVFATRRDAVAAYHRGEIGVGHPIEIVQS